MPCVATITRKEGACLDLRELSERTRIETRKLRYCLDHGLLIEPEIEFAERERGQPRRFGEDVAFDLVCAAWLVDLGLPHPRIRMFLALMGRVPLGRDRLIGGPRPSRSIVRRAVDEIRERRLPGRARLGDGAMIRVEVCGDAPFDSGWVTPYGHSVDANWTPNVEVTLDLGRVGEVLGVPPL